MGPKVVARLRIDELTGNPNAVAAPPHAPFQDVADAQITGDLSYIERLAFIGESRIAGDHEKRMKTGESCDDVLGYADGEVFLIGIA